MVILTLTKAAAPPADASADGQRTPCETHTPATNRDSLPACKYLRVSRFVGSSHRAGVSHLVEYWGGADLVMAAVKDADQHQSQVCRYRTLLPRSSKGFPPPLEFEMRVVSCRWSILQFSFFCFPVFRRVGCWGAATALPICARGPV